MILFCFADAERLILRSSGNEGEDGIKSREFRANLEAAGKKEEVCMSKFGGVVERNNKCRSYTSKHLKPYNLIAEEKVHIKLYPPASLLHLQLKESIRNGERGIKIRNFKGDDEKEGEMGVQKWEL